MYILFFPKADGTTEQLSVVLTLLLSAIKNF